MKLNHGLNLAYCTNIHRGENWAQTFATLEKYTLAVRDRVSPSEPYAIGLRLGDRASRELSDAETLRNFRKWLDANNCYVFTINGFPFGQFHGSKVKENVYWPDWTTNERVEYTNRLFDLIAQLMPADVEGSVSTVPGSFKEFIKNPDQLKAIRGNLFRSVEHIARVSERSGRKLHLGLEPEPLCLLETTAETVGFFGQLRAEFHNDPRLFEFLGVNYDTCHLAVEFEEPHIALEQFARERIGISKLHLSNALKVKPTPAIREELKKFTDPVYLHQVVERNQSGALKRFKDLPDALSTSTFELQTSNLPEWRIHFHVPLHSPKNGSFDNTSDHLLGTLDFLAKNPGLCSHLEMETYTWEVMPLEMKNRNVVDQLVSEYAWTLQRLAERGLARARHS